MSANSSSKRSISRSKPITGRIGIFWWWKGRLLAVTSSISDGESTAGVVDSKLAHATAWRLFQSRIRRLRKTEYDVVPRGRILFVKGSSLFRVLMDKRLFRPSVMAAIRRRFRLPKQKTTFQTDAHYTTDTDTLSRLLED